MDESKNFLNKSLEILVVLYFASTIICLPFILIRVIELRELPETILAYYMLILWILLLSVGICIFGLFLIAKRGLLNISLGLLIITFSFLFSGGLIYLIFCL